MDTLVSMRVFATVVEAGSFAAAAQRLGLSRAMVSKHMAHIENHLGARLLNRTTRRLSLTETGSVYFTHCQQILKDLEEAELVATRLTSSPRGTLRVAAPLEFGMMHIGPLLPDYLSLYPEIRLDFTLENRLVHLVEEGYDMAIRLGATPEAGLITRKLATDGFVVCASPDYLQRHGVPRVPADLMRHTCLNYTGLATGAEWRFVGRDGEHTVRMDGNLRANNADMLRNAALGGAGIIVVPRFLVGPDIRAKRLQTVLTEYKTQELSIYVIYPSRKYLSAKVRSFIDFLASRLGPESNWPA